MNKPTSLIIENFYSTEVKFRINWGACHSVDRFHVALDNFAVKYRKKGIKVLVGGGTRVGNICILHPKRKEVETIAKEFIGLLCLYDAEDNA